PSAPTTVVATRSGDTSIITFQASGSADTVGYRLYRSVNRSGFKAAGKVITAGAETKFSDQTAGTGVFGYYVTAVDVAGKESVPSKASFTDGTSVDTLFLTPDENGVINPGQSTGNTNGNPANGTAGTGTNKGTGSSSAPVTGVPSAPSGLTLKTSGAGLVLNWKENADKEQVNEYIIYFNDKENGTFKKLGSVNKGTEFRYYATAYDGFYKLAAVNQAGESKPSKAVYFKK
ncbi:MAG: carboxypeptidase, partial [Paenibacillus sp.]|nr:carboxypeptidase [Paenibacillus sp.]